MNSAQFKFSFDFKTSMTIRMQHSVLKARFSLEVSKLYIVNVF